MGFLFGSKPKPADPVRMPTSSSEEASRLLGIRKQKEIMARSGRRSTVLSGSGGGAYTNSLLGQS